LAQISEKADFLVIFIYKI